MSTTQFENLGEVSNKGVEILLTATPVRLADFTWDVAVSAWGNKNRLVELGEGLCSEVVVAAEGGEQRCFPECTCKARAKFYAVTALAFGLSGGAFARAMNPVLWARRQDAAPLDREIREAEMVAVSMGAEGALLASGEGAIRRASPHVKVRSAIGAGDSFLGAMVWALCEGWSREAAFELGIAAGAAAVVTPGTQLCRREDIEALYPMPAA